MASKEPLLDVAAAMADGTAVDWESASQSITNDEDRGLLTELRFIAGLMPSVTPAASARKQEAPGPTATHDSSGESWGPLNIIEYVGCGTFGDVYRAWDSRLDREVALKILRRKERDDHAHACTVIQEGRLLARIRHPNVVTVYGAERVRGQIGVWMEFVHGKTLEEELRDQGPFDADRVIRIGIELSGALSTVHRAGLIHGDIKAQNVLCDRDGRLVLTDFGAGIQLEEAPNGGACELAATPLCVAPEVLAGQPVSQRSDLYSLAVLLYHLLTGMYPVRGRSLNEVREAHATQTRVPLHEARPDSPHRLVHIIDRALDPDPSHRHEALDMFHAELSRLVSTGRDAPSPTSEPAGASRRRQWLTSGVVGLAVVAISSSMAYRACTVPDASSRIRLAVLPIAAGGGQDDLWTRGLAENLVDRLQDAEGVRTVTDPSLSALGKQTMSFREIGRRLSADAIVTLNVRRSGSAVDVRARLVALPDEQEIWSERFTRSNHEVFAIEADIARRVASVLRRPLGRVERRWPTVVPEAYELYLLGSAAAERRGQSGRLALQLFEQAVALDPAFAQAHAAIAQLTLENPASLALPAGQRYERAKAAAERALALDSELPEAHLAAADIQSALHDWTGTEREYRRAIELAPNRSLVREEYAKWLSLHGRFTEAIAEADRSVALVPLSPRSHYTAGLVRRFARQCEEARPRLEKALELDPQDGPAHHELGQCHQMDGRHDLAVEAYRRGAQPPGNLGHALAASGRTAEARMLLAQLLESQRQGGSIAQIYIGLGEYERALDWLERDSLPTRGPGTLKVAAVWDPLRSHPRFTAVLRKRGLAP